MTGAAAALSDPPVPLPSARAADRAADLLCLFETAQAAHQIGYVLTFDRSGAHVVFGVGEALEIVSPYEAMLALDAMAADPARDWWPAWARDCRAGLTDRLAALGFDPAGTRGGAG